jgi:NADPH:quinone reductase-like Zn-dependent oxidoreductase
LIICPGAKHVISYKRQLKPQLEKLDIHGVDYIFNGYDTSVYLDQYVEIINHYGKIVSIVNNNQPLNLGPLMMKRVSFSWELMFTRALVGGEDMINQHYILDTLAQLVECGLIRVKIDQQLHFNVANLRSAHQMIEGGHTHGKIVLFR